VKRKESWRWAISRLDVVKVDRPHTKPTLCYYCGKKFSTPKGVNYHWHYKRDDVCYDCVNTQLLYRQEYGFWLRFASEHFIPCSKCQDKLHEMLMTKPVAFHKPECITIESIKDGFRFLLRFIEVSPPDQMFVPCKKCQRKLIKMWEIKELHVGNENKPMVELWRRWEIVDGKERKVNYEPP